MRKKNNMEINDIDFEQDQQDLIEKSQDIKKETITTKEKERTKIINCQTTNMVNKKNSLRIINMMMMKPDLILRNIIKSNMIYDYSIQS